MKYNGIQYVNPRGTLRAPKSENQERLHIIVKIEEDLKGYGRRLQREGVCKFF